MKKYIFILLLTFVFILTNTPASAELKTAGKVHTLIKGNQLIVSTDQGYHLNKEAPSSLKVDGGQKLQPNKAGKEFTFKLPTPSGEGQLEVYACDDANTVCEPHRLLVIWGTHKENKNSSMENDFIKNNYSFALEEAKKNRKLVFIDFQGKWCPPCIRLEHEVFNTPEFKALKKNYIFLSIDVDMESNYELMNQYSVRAFPTLVVVNAKGGELARFLDFQEKTYLVKSLQDIFKSKPVDVETLIAKSKNADSLVDAKTLLSLADYYSKSLQFEEAARSFEKSLGLRYFEAKVAALEDNSEGSGKPVFEAGLKNAILAFPDSFQALMWRHSLAKSLGFKTEEGKKVYQEALASIQKWIDQPALITEAHKAGQLLEIKDLVLSEIYYLQAEIYKEMNSLQKSKDSYEKAVVETLKQNPSIKNPTLVIYLIAYMKPVRPLNEIEPWIEKLETAYPNEFTYPQRHAKLLLDKGQPEKALGFAQRAHDLSYGNNKFTSGLLLAQIKAEMKKKDEAKAHLNKLLASPEAASPRNKRVVKNIQDFLKKMN